MPSIREEITRTFVRFGKLTLGRSAPAAVWLREKADVGQYRIIRKLGSGGMGQVYLALDTKLGRHVALKVLSPQLTADPAHVARFKQEAHAASALNHPNILTIFDFCEIDGAQVIVSEFVEGVTLRVALERGLIDVKLALDITVQVASALAAAHAAGVVHRDLKPTNIMIRPDGYVKIIDFGLAKLAERSGEERPGEQTLTRPGTVVGTLRYMSPEQARGEDVDSRGDLWSLGVVLYEMLASYPPFEGSTDNHLIVAILDAPPKPLPHDLAVPPALHPILKQALAKNKRDRYQSAGDLLLDLQALQPAGKAASTIRLHRHTGGPARRWIMSAALALLLALIFVWWGPLGGRWRIQGPDWFEVGQVDRLTFEGDVQRASLSPDGKWLAFAAGAPGSEILHLRSVPGGREQTLPPTSATYAGLTFSQDSKNLFLVLRDAPSELGTLFSIPVAAFGRDPEATLLRDLDGPIAFSPDGRSFAFVRFHEATDTASILIAPVDDVQNARSIVSMPESQLMQELSWSEAGIAAVVYPSRVGEPTKACVYLYSPSGKLLREITATSFRSLRMPVFQAGGNSLFVEARTRGALQYGLQQLFLPTGDWRSLSSDLAGFSDISTTRNGDLIAAVRSTSRSSIWVAAASHLESATQLITAPESFSSIAWMNDGRLLVPSARMGNVNLMALDAAGRMQPIMQPQVAVQQSPAAAPGRREVVFSSNAARGGDEFNLWKVVPDQTEPVLLTSGPNYDSEAQITPDGKSVLFTSFVSGAQTLWEVPLAGGRPRQVSPYRIRRPSISADGRTIVCELRPQHESWVVAVVSLANGEIVRRLPSIPIGQLVRWSPDATAVDYLANLPAGSSLLRQALNGGPPRVLLNPQTEQILYFAWNQAGDKIAYVTGRADTDAVLLHRASRN